MCLPCCCCCYVLAGLTCSAVRHAQPMGCVAGGPTVCCTHRCARSVHAHVVGCMCICCVLSLHAAYRRLCTCGHTCVVMTVVSHVTAVLRHIHTNVQRWHCCNMALSACCMPPAGVAVKEGFCYGKWEAGVLAGCVPLLLLGHLTQLLPVQAEQGLLAVTMGTMVVFAARKYTQASAAHYALHVPLQQHAGGCTCFQSCAHVPTTCAIASKRQLCLQRHL